MNTEAETITNLVADLATTPTNLHPVTRDRVLRDSQSMIILLLQDIREQLQILNASP